VASLQQKIDERTSNIPGPAGDEDAMRNPVLGTIFCRIRSATEQKKSMGRNLSESLGSEADG
jgi:hypothetical protein